MTMQDNYPDTFVTWLANLDNVAHLMEGYQYYKNNLEAYDDLGEDLTIQEFAIYLYEQEKLALADIDQQVLEVAEEISNRTNKQ